MEKQGEVKNRMSIICAALFLLFFYCIIFLYVMLSVIQVDLFENLVCGIVFEIIGCGVLTFVVVCAITKKPYIKIGYMIPVTVCTVIYSILLNVLNIVGSVSVTGGFFFLLHLVLLFVYSLIVIPMFLMGKQ